MEMNENNINSVASVEESNLVEHTISIEVEQIGHNNNSTEVVNGPAVNEVKETMVLGFLKTYNGKQLILFCIYRNGDGINRLRHEDPVGSKASFENLKPRGFQLHKQITAQESRTWLFV
uniref:TDP43_N domain-containing protein n=1 Tax=Rhabditophanes sp. KR3021 TaxID=114890 RepID=A0AC35U6M3_9BILA